MKIEEMETAARNSKERFCEKIINGKILKVTVSEKGYRVCIRWGASIIPRNEAIEILKTA